MKYPEWLIKKVQKRAHGMKLEGLNEGAGPQDPALMIVGEAPGRDEIVSHVPFHGSSGKELMKSLALIGLTRDDVYITSVVRSRPYATKTVFSKKENKDVIKHPNRKPTKKEVLAHAPFFDYEVAHVQPKIIVTVGGTAIERLLGPGHSISREHGQVIKQTPILQLNVAEDGYEWSKEKYTLIMEYHPAAVFYNRKLTETIKEDWLALKPYLDIEKD
ncbi:uracil-DNA glycosylase [Lactobacillus sp. ESL0680]|uniref:uracil-DNA glycosylase n=1 Tax=Lactobacillus sp. ESL0680 TaxID=2983210 RepID=UPI0023F8DEF7|nr:uracil-DNA glycosylase [Lactobacillus sp. ESL0680]WEV38085.1 uracil-DNA glycosylase [Lactobacillus sp. ESL0680]